MIRHTLHNICGGASSCYLSKLYLSFEIGSSSFGEEDKNIGTSQRMSLKEMEMMFGIRRLAVHAPPTRTIVLLVGEDCIKKRLVGLRD